MERLVIRQEQIAALEAVQAEHFQRRVLERVDRDWPAMWPKPAPEALAGWVKEALAEARRVGVDVERDVMLFVLATVVLGPGFARDPSRPWVQAILGDPTLDGSQKMAVFTKQLADHLRESEGA